MSWQPEERTRPPSHPTPAAGAHVARPLGRQDAPAHRRSGAQEPARPLAAANAGTRVQGAGGESSGRGLAGEVLSESARGLRGVAAATGLLLNHPLCPACIPPSELCIKVDRGRLGGGCGGRLRVRSGVGGGAPRRWQHHAARALQLEPLRHRHGPPVQQLTKPAGAQLRQQQAAPGRRARAAAVSGDGWLAVLSLPTHPQLPVPASPCPPLSWPTHRRSPSISWRRRAVRS